MPTDLFGRMDLQHTVIATKLHKTITIVTIITNIDRIPFFIPIIFMHTFFDPTNCCTRTKRKGLSA